MLFGYGLQAPNQLKHKTLSNGLIDFIAGMAASMATAKGLNGIEAGAKKLAKPKLGDVGDGGGSAFARNNLKSVLANESLTLDEFNTDRKSVV